MTSYPPQRTHTIDITGQTIAVDGGTVMS